jgi:hypothetical protein
MMLRIFHDFYSRKIPYLNANLVEVSMVRFEGRARRQCEQEVLQSNTSDRHPLLSLRVLCWLGHVVDLLEVPRDLVRPSDVLKPVTLQGIFDLSEQLKKKCKSVGVTKC